VTRESARLDRSRPAPADSSTVAHHTVITPGQRGGKLSIPLVPWDMIEYLRNQFPMKMSRDHTERDYDAILGHQEVIQHLEALYAEQNPKG
jgi:hypothetical protein